MTFLHWIIEEGKGLAVSIFALSACRVNLVDREICTSVCFSKTVKLSSGGMGIPSVRILSGNNRGTIKVKCCINVAKMNDKENR